MQRTGFVPSSLRRQPEFSTRKYFLAVRKARGVDTSGTPQRFEERLYVKNRGTKGTTGNGRSREDVPLHRGSGMKECPLSCLANGPEPAPVRANPAPSGGWLSPLHALLPVQESPLRLYESWGHRCRHRRPFPDNCRSRCVRQSSRP